MRPVHRSWLRTLAVGALALTACTETDRGLTPPAQGEDLLTISSMQSLTAAQVIQDYPKMRGEPWKAG